MTKKDIENKRKTLQITLDSLKTQKERNVLGQFSTPYRLANDILIKAKQFLPKKKNIKFLDPAIGTGVFFSALLNNFPENRLERAVGFEIDNHYGLPSMELWKYKNLEYKIEDFSINQFPSNDKEKFNLIVCNPPYVRHHHINGQKQFLKEKAFNAINQNISSLAGLYCYFIAFAHRWMTPNGIGIWLVPSEFMDVNYGKSLKKYFTSEVTLIQVHRFDPDDLQFKDALVTSSVLIIKNSPPPKNHLIQLTFGADLNKPQLSKTYSNEELKLENKWTRFPFNEIRSSKPYSKLKDFFKIKRGIATGDNSFFILSKVDAISRNIPFQFLRPILPSPRHISTQIINADENGNPEIDKKLFVLDCNLPIEVIEKKYPSLFKYLEEGVSRKVTERYICRNRKIWYSQENREVSDFYFTYIGRSSNGQNSFRFILNNSNSIVNNSYLMLYPNEELKAIIKDNEEVKKNLLTVLNEMTQHEFIEQGRVYGGGMRKFEPKELSNVNSELISKFVERNSVHHNKEPNSNNSSLM